MADKAVSKNIDTILLANIYCDNFVWDFLSSKFNINISDKSNILRRNDKRDRTFMVCGKYIAMLFNNTMSVVHTKIFL